MKLSDLQDAIIPKLKTHTGVPVIREEQAAERPDGPHATFKFTSPYLKDAGQPNATFSHDETTAYLDHSESFKVALSVTAYSLDFHESVDLAESLRDWFVFHGQLDLDDLGIVVVDAREVENRDVLVADNYERRHGFDVILRVPKSLTMAVDYFDKVETEVS